MAHLNYNANDHEDMKDMTPVPKGKYSAIIESTKLGESKGEKHTQQLEITWVIVGGEHDGRKVTNWVTVACDTAVARDIGMRFIKNICEAVGIAGFTDTDELVGREHVIDVGSVKKQGDGGDKEFSEVKRCYPAGTAPTAPSASQTRPANTAPANTPAQATTQQARPTPPAGGAGRPPWMK